MKSKDQYFLKKINTVDSYFGSKVPDAVTL